MVLEKKRLLSYGFVLIVIAIAATILTKYGAESNRPFHTNISTISAMTSLFAGLLSLVRYFAKRSCPYLWIGLAFFGNSIIEVTYVYTYSFFPDFESGVPWAIMIWGWWIGRMYLSIMLLGSYLTCGENPYQKDSLAYIIGTPLLLVSLTALAFLKLEPLTRDSFLARPLELVPATFFAITLVGYYRQSHWKTKEFHHWLILSLIMCTATQFLVIPFSRHIYDTKFMFSNILRTASHLVMSIGLLAEIFKLYRSAQVETKRLETLRLMIDQVKDYALFMLDTTGHIASWNKGAEAIKGYTADEIIGKHFSVFYPDEDNLAGKPAMELREAVKQGHYLDEGWRIKKDGSRFWAYVLITPVYNDAGTLLGFSKVTRDLTERKMAEEELQRKNELLTESNQRLNTLRLMIDQIKDYALFLLDTTGHIATWNKGAQYIKGYTADEIIGKHFSQFYSEEDKKAGKPEMELREAVKQGRYIDEGWRIKKDGSRFWAYVLITPVYDEEGILIGFSKVTRDLTERRMAEEELRRKNVLLTHSNEELQQFAYIATHDLKEPLRSISSFTELLVRQCRHISEQTETYSNYVIKAVKRLAKLIDDLRTYNIIGKEGVEPKEVDMNECLNDALNLLKRKIDEHKAIIHTVKLPVITGTASQFTYMFMHLVDNAIKYAKPDVTPVINIGCKESKTEYTFSIQDNGIGIPKEFEEKIFTIFRKLVSHEKKEGSGIGLSICKKVVLLYGGNIWFSPNDAGGTTFYFTLPKIFSAARVIEK